jgi:ribosome biogenesis GTPase
VGDWVAVDGNGVIAAILPRRTTFKRMAADASRLQPGLDDEQIMAANVDVALLVAGLDHDFNLRRIERYLAVAWSSEVTPVVVLNKADLADDVDERLMAVEAIAPGVAIVAVSAWTGLGMDTLRSHLRPARTAAILGSSGVGKSTLVNALLGEDRQATAAVRGSDSRGRHTTTHRELFELPGGGLLVDTPGMRAIGLWDAEDGLDRAFEDIDVIAVGCRFGDCAHDAEPGCAVRAAIERGELDATRLESRRKLERELKSIERRMSVAAERAESRRMGKLYRDAGKMALRKQRPWEARP